jgi:hypothetical protein
LEKKKGKTKNVTPLSDRAVVVCCPGKKEMQNEKIHT